MTIDLLNGFGNAGDLLADSQSPYAGAAKQLGQDDFLKLLVTQMRHQDPLNPMDSTGFTAQLAQYSSLEQLVGVNTKLEALNASQDQAGRNQALDFIGKRIVADGNQLSLDADGGATGGFSIDQDAECAVLVLDSGGRAVSEMHLGSRRAGGHSFQWDGRTSSGNRAAPGVYQFEVRALDAAGNAVDAFSRVAGKVTRVNLQGGRPLLYVGDIPVALSEIADIQL